MTAPNTGTGDGQTRKYKRVNLSGAHLFEGLRYLAGIHVVPVEFNVRQGEVLDEDVPASEYKVPDQSVDEMRDIRDTIAPREKAPIGGDTSGKLQQVPEEPDDTPVAGADKGKAPASQPSAVATSGSKTKDK